jgi:hypothetical protein
MVKFSNDGFVTGEDKLFDYFDRMPVIERPKLKFLKVFKLALQNPQKTKYVS